MPSLRRFALSLVAVAGASACSADANTEGVDDAEQGIVAKPAVHHVLLASGGFNSCDPGAQGVLPSELRPLVDEIERRSGTVPTVVRTCFGGVGDADRFEYVVTRGSVNLYGGSTTLQSLESRLRTLLAERLPSRFDAYGHSHGGWLAAKVVSDLGPGTSQSFTANVYLSDPVSRALCTPQVVISGVGRSDYCARFPPDLNASVIRQNTKGWLGTAFQSDDWLRSTPIAGANEVRALNPGKPVNAFARNHRALYTLPLTLGLVTNRFSYP